jgi:SAM-dependent methyltransferase
MPIDEQDAIRAHDTATTPTGAAVAADPASIDVSSYPTVDNDWEKLAAEYPDIYERFANAPNDGALSRTMRQLVSFKDKIVLDLGAGTGQYAFDFAGEAFKILGMEADPDLVEFDSQVIAERGYTNIIPFHGLANDLPINDEVVDIALAVTVAPWDPDPLIRLGLRKRMVEETLRVLKPGGVFIVVTVPEGAYGGELAPIIFDDPAQLPNNSDWDAQLVEDFGFKFTEIESVSDYGSVENAVATYGFIFGRNAIRHLLAHQKHTITWRYRLLWTQKPESPAANQEAGG